MILYLRNDEIDNFTFFFYENSSTFLPLLFDNLWSTFSFSQKSSMCNCNCNSNWLIQNESRQTNLFFLTITMIANCSTVHTIDWFVKRIFNLSVKVIVVVIHTNKYDQPTMFKTTPSHIPFWSKLSFIFDFQKLLSNLK